MTLKKIVTIGNRRCGLTYTSNTSRDGGIDYFNMFSLWMAGVTQWRFLNKTTSFPMTITLTITGATGTFVADEVLTGGTSGKTCVVVSHDLSGGTVTVKTPSGALTASETLTGGTNSYTATLSSEAGTREYDLASDFVAPRGKFRNATLDTMMGWTDAEPADETDPDKSETGDPNDFFILSINASTGLWIAEVVPAPPTSSSFSDNTIHYRYRAQIPTFSNTDEDENMNKYIPEPLQPAWVHGIPAMYFEEKGGMKASAREWRHVGRYVKQYLDLNVEQDPEEESFRADPVVDFGFPTEGAELVVHAQAS